MGTAIRNCGLLVAALSLCSGCIVHTKTVESTVRSKPRTETLPEDAARAQLATRLTSKGLEVTAWQRQECTTQRVQEVRTVSRKEAALDSPNCSGDICGAIVMLGMPITALSLLVAVAELAASDDKVIAKEQVLLWSETVDCSRPIRRARLRGFVDGQGVSAMTDERGRALLSPSTRTSWQSWHLIVDGLPTTADESLDLRVENPSANWTVAFEAPVAASLASL